MKKAMVFLMVVGMLLIAAACGNNVATDGNDRTSGDSDTGTINGDVIELTFWAHQEESWNNSYKEIAEAFTADNPNIKIKFEFYPYDEFESKIQTSLIAKSGGADLYEIWGGWANDFAPTGALAAIPNDMAVEFNQDSYPSTIGSLEHEGKLYGMPMEFNIECGAMLVNLDLLEQNGLTIPTTWNELIETAKQASVMEGVEFKVKGFDFVNWDSVPYLMTSMILSNGGRYLNEDGTFNFTSPQAKEAFTELASLVQEHKVTNLIGLTGGGDLEGYQELFANKALFVPRGPWCIAEGIQTFELTYDEDFTYVAMPWYGKDIAFAAETGWSLAVNGSSDKQEAAFKFLEYFYNDEVLLQHNINCGMIPPKKSVAHSEELVSSMPFVEPLVEILEKAQYIGHFNTDFFKEAINNTFVDYCSGVYGSIDEALTQLEEFLNNELA